MLKKANAFNHFFHSTFTPEDNYTPAVSEPHEAYGHARLDEIHLSIDEVSKILASLDPRKAHGPDNIPTIVLQRCADEIAVSLCVLFNRSLSSGRIPVEWK